MQLLPMPNSLPASIRAPQLWRKLRLKVGAVLRFKQRISSHGVLQLPFILGERPREPWESEPVSAYLDTVYETSQSVQGAFDGIKTLLKSAKGDRLNPDNAPHQARILCNYLSGFPFLMLKFKAFFPDDCDFTLDDDFDQTRLITVTTPDEKVHHIASFGLISLHDGDPHFSRSDNKIIKLLRKVLELPVFEPAILSLEGGDARRTLELMLEAVSDDLRWDNLIGNSPILLRNSASKRERLNRLLIKLSCDSCELPPSMYIRTTEVSPISVSAGGFADVFRGKYGDSVVALKRLKLHGAPSQHPPDILEIFYREVLIWRRARHLNIIPLLGIDRTTFAKEKHGTTLCMVSPWYYHGNILRCSEMLENKNSTVPFTQWLREFASGLAFLHENDIAHGDIRSDNILIDENCHVRISDFGLSIITNNIHTRPNGTDAGSDRWLPPERLTYEDPQVLHEGDIYSFACVCIELATKRPPFHGVHRNAVPREVLAGRRPPRPSGLPRSLSDELWQLMEQCWSQSHADRPSSSELERQLNEMNETIM